MNFFTSAAFATFALFLPTIYGQDTPVSSSAVTDSAVSQKPQEKVTLDANDPASKYEDKRVLGVLPNYRTAELTSDYHPISSAYKMHIALKDSFDYPLLMLGAAYAGIFQLEDSHHQLGQGTLGFLKRFGTSYNDQLMGNMLSEGLLPIVFKEDPRYFRLGVGLKKKRAAYAFSRIFVTKTDAGGTSFNYAEVVGNSIAAAASLSYYSDSRNVPDYLGNLGIDLATDGISQVLKEFWPDLKHRYFHRDHAASAPLAGQRPSSLRD